MPQITIPEPENALPPLASSEPWAAESIAPGPLDAWSTSTPVPLGVGAGWAETVTANATTQDTLSYSHQSNQVPTEVSAHLPPHDVNAAGPIEVSSSTTLVESILPLASVSTNVDAGPPGLGKRANARPQEAAVVMPSHERNTTSVTATSTGGIERVGVQFGSLNMFDGQDSTFGQQVPLQESAVPSQQDQSYVFIQTPFSFSSSRWIWDSGN